MKIKSGMKLKVNMLGVLKEIIFYRENNREKRQWGAVDGEQ